MLSTTILHKRRRANVAPYARAYPYEAALWTSALQGPFPQSRVAIGALPCLNAVAEEKRPGAGKRPCECINCKLNFGMQYMMHQHLTLRVNLLNVMAQEKEKEGRDKALAALALADLCMCNGSSAPAIQAPWSPARTRPIRPEDDDFEIPTAMVKRGVATRKRGQRGLARLEEGALEKPTENGALGKVICEVR